MEKRLEKKNFSLLYSIQALLSVGFSITGEFLTLLLSSFGLTRFLIGVVTGVRDFSSLFFQIIWAHHSDRTGRRKLFIFCGTFLWAIFWLPILYTKSVFVLFALVALQGISAAMISPAWDALLIKITNLKNRPRILANVFIAESVVAFIASISAAYLVKFCGLTSLFVIGAIVAFISCVLVLLLEEPEEKKNPHESIFKGIHNTICDVMFRKTKLRSFFYPILFWYFATGITVGFISLYIVEELGATIEFFAISVAVFAVSNFLSYKMWQRLAEKKGKTTTLLLSSVMIAGSLLFFLVIKNYISALPAQFFAGMGWAGFDISANLLLMERIPKEDKAQHLAVTNTFLGLVALIAPIIGGLISTYFTIWHAIFASFMLRTFGVMLLKDI